MTEYQHEHREEDEVILLRNMHGHAAGTVVTIVEAGPAMLLVSVSDYPDFSVHHSHVGLLEIPEFSKRVGEQAGQTMEASAESASVYDAIFTSVASEEEASIEEVAEVLAHREVCDDFFWTAWDNTVREARSLFREVTGRPEPEEV